MSYSYIKLNFNNIYKVGHYAFKSGIDFDGVPTFVCADLDMVALFVVACFADHSEIYPLGTSFARLYL